MDKRSIPSKILDIIEENKKPRERYDIFALLVRYEEEDYYCVSYYKGKTTTGYLFISKEGSVPAREKIREVARLSIAANYINLTFYSVGRQFSRRNSNSIVKALNITNKCLKLGEDLPSIDACKEAFESILAMRSEYDETAERLNATLNRIGRSGIFHPQDYSPLNDLHLRLGELLFRDNYVQMETYDDRRKVISFLLKKGRIIDALRFWLIHLRLHPGHVSARDLDNFNKVKRKFLQNEAIEDEEKELENNILSITRNPK
ncbi:hypothetical protein [Laceyella sacchari]|uniref:Uncharacterized protein n=1 Tax=Laceyella sacchari TaxID=37482 RepID=A0ABY5U461_LACSH|nr:hypothetical protein [Laceyella sacchari]UWE03805.1 hypothetical protein NYR52_00915 [Laceyella sacchari]